MSRKSPHTLFTDLLTALGVPHTEAYSRSSFESMPFPTLFGLKTLLSSYGVDAEGLRLAAPGDMLQLQAPFVAVTKNDNGMVIVTSASADRVDYLTGGVAESMPADEFFNVCTGEVFTASPREDACEPDYSSHRVTEVVSRLRNILLVAGAAALFIYAFVANRIYASPSLIFVTLFDCAGLYISYLLLQKMLNISNPHADRICSVLQAEGCDDILKTGASKAFGVFSWSEVGFTYFSVSLLTLLIFPQYAGYLCLLNACCLPYTVWSIWYQHFRAHAWCTLCVCVQATLWALFICYLCGGWWHTAFPLSWPFWVILALYGTVLMALSRVFELFEVKED